MDIIPQTFQLLATGLVDAGQAGIPEISANSVTMRGIFNAVLAVVGVVAVIFIILGGIRYSIAQGGAADIQKAKEMIIYALVGLGIVIFSFTIVNFIVGRF